MYLEIVTPSQNSPIYVPGLWESVPANQTEIVINKIEYLLRNGRVAAGVRREIHEIIPEIESLLKELKKSVREDKKKMPASKKPKKPN